MKIDEIKNRYKIDWALFNVLNDRRFKDFSKQLVVKNDIVKRIVVKKDFSNAPIYVLIDWGMGLQDKVLDTYTYSFIGKTLGGSYKEFCKMVPALTPDTLRHYFDYVRECIYGSYSISNIEQDSNVFNEWLVEKGYTLVNVDDGGHDIWTVKNFEG